MNLSFTLKEVTEMPDFYPMPSFPSVVADAKDIDTSISTAKADLFYTGPTPGPAYLTFAASKVDGVDIPESFRAGGIGMTAKSRMNGN